MTKSVFIAFLTTSLIILGGAVYQYNQSNQAQQVQHEDHSQHQATDALMERLQSQTCSIHEDGSIVMISEHDSQAYLVGPQQTLSQAIAQGALAQERGNCVREDPDNPPEEGEVACKCFEQTNCGGQESSTCKRHCKRNLCKCCPGV